MYSNKILKFNIFHRFFDIFFKLFLLVVFIVICFFIIKYSSSVDRLMNNSNNFVTNLPTEINYINTELNKLTNETLIIYQKLMVTNRKLDIIMDNFIKYNILLKLNNVLENLESFNVTEFMIDLDSITYDLSKIIPNNHKLNLLL